MEWKNFPYFHTFTILANFRAVYILSLVIKAALDQIHKMIKKVVTKSLLKRLDQGSNL